MLATRGAVILRSGEERVGRICPLGDGWPGPGRIVFEYLEGNRASLTLPAGLRGVLACHSPRGSNFLGVKFEAVFSSFSDSDSLVLNLI